MEELVSLQRQYFNSNVTKTLEFRVDKLNRLLEILQSNEKLFYQAILDDYGKGEFETRLTELYLVYEEIKAALKNIKQWQEPKFVETNFLNAPAKSYYLMEPLGVSLIVGPWNYPLQLLLAPLVGAIAAGCTAVLKPSELTPHCSALLASLINSNFPRQYIAVVEGGIPETTALLEQKFDFIFFTGSVPVGKIVYQAAAKNLTPVVLELGGKSPVIIMPDCDLDITVKRLVWGKFLNAGQTCIAPDYVLVHETIKDEFLKKLTIEIQKREYKSENENFVKIVNERNTQRLVRLIDPKKIYLGGTFDIAARHIEPTVLTGVTWEDAVMQEEIFGPILPVLTFQSLEVAIARIKEQPKPLSLYLFTNDDAVKERILSEISFGGGCINETVMHVTNGNLPFGGVGNSGIGKYHGEDGFKAFSNAKSILEKTFDQELDTKYSPYTPENLLALKSLMV